MNAPERFEMFVLPDGIEISRFRSMAGEVTGVTNFGEFGVGNNMMAGDNSGAGGAGGMYSQMDSTSGMHEEHDTDF
ncbi:hypothetical protein AYI70_g467 [Smittium culicis]|uniref:Uncharacterized protein n=1 Tax=Smittium culicis TaxID=133412 RepID=A0A1R1YGN0_9FUNG|nr:hypothetical protein AYI70_g467 [Smittium culicis]